MSEQAEGNYHPDDAEKTKLTAVELLEKPVDKSAEITKLTAVEPFEKPEHGETELVEFRVLEETLFNTYEKIKNGLDKEQKLAEEFEKSGKPASSTTMEKISQLQILQNKIQDLYKENVDDLVKDAMQAAKEGAHLFVAQPEGIARLLENAKSLISEPVAEISAATFIPEHETAALRAQEDALRKQADEIRTTMMEVTSQFLQFKNAMLNSEKTQEKWQQSEQAIFDLSQELRNVKEKLKIVRSLLQLPRRKQASAQEQRVA